MSGGPNVGHGHVVEQLRGVVAAVSGCNPVFRPHLERNLDQLAEREAVRWRLWRRAREAGALRNVDAGDVVATIERSTP